MLIFGFCYSVEYVRQKFTIKVIQFKRVAGFPQLSILMNVKGTFKKKILKGKFANFLQVKAYSLYVEMDV